MYFTQDDYRKIEEWLSHRTVKDSEFPEANPLDGTETFPILQDKKNKIIKFGDFIKQVSEMEVHDIYNVSALHNAYGISREEAIALVPEWKRKRGLIISYRTKDITSGQVVISGGWAIEQFIGETLDDWNKESWWEDIVLRWFNKFVGQANGIAPLDENGLVPLAYLPPIGEVYNASAELNNYNLSRFEAIDSVPDWRKKLGLIITFCSKPGNWDILQFQGTSLDLWKSYGYWRNIHQEVLDLMGQPNGIATLNSDGKIDYVDLEDIPKSKVGLSNVTNDAQVKRSEMGVANGVATLNSNGTVPSTQLPSYVDDVLEFNTLNDLPTYGEAGKIYVTKDTNLTYRWTGSQYTEISKSLALGETSSTAYAGNEGKKDREALNSLPNHVVYSIKDFTSTNNDVTFNYGFNTKGSNNKYSNSTNASKTIAAATTTAAGVMSARDKKTVDSLPNVIVTGSYNEADANHVVIYDQQVAKQDDGTYAEITDASIIFPTATQQEAGVMTAEDKQLLDALPKSGFTNKGFTVGLSPSGASFHTNFSRAIKDEDGRYQSITENVKVCNIPVVDESVSGLMSPSDKKLLNSTPEYIGTGEIAFHRNAEDVVIDVKRVKKGTNNTYASTGDGHLPIPPATSELAGTMSAADKSKLIGIEEGAQVNSITSVAGKTGQVLLNKNDVGLDAVDNTSDEDKPLSHAARTAITNLSTNIETKLDKRSVTDIEILESISNPDGGYLVYVEDSNAYYYFSDLYDWARIINDADLDAKVDKVTGKQLSTNDFSNTYKDILDDPWQEDLPEFNGQ